MSARTSCAIHEFHSSTASQIFSTQWNGSKEPGFVWRKPGQSVNSLTYRPIDPRFLDVSCVHPPFMFFSVLLLRFQQGVGQSTGSTSGTRSFLAADALEVGQVHSDTLHPLVHWLLHRLLVAFSVPCISGSCCFLQKSHGCEVSSIQM